MTYVINNNWSMLLTKAKSKDDVNSCFLQVEIVWLFSCAVNTINRQGYLN